MAINRRLFLKSALIGATTLLVPETTILAQEAVRIQLGPGEELRAGQYLDSPNRLYRFIMQADGNAVLYQMSTGKALWATDTRGSGAIRMSMQLDGNLVAYTARNRSVWASNTGGGRARLQCQDDANLVIVREQGGPIWASNTEVIPNSLQQENVRVQLSPGEELRAGQHLDSPNRLYRFIMQADGNAVLYQMSTGKALWATDTRGSGAIRMSMQLDGNLVAYTARNRSVWASNTGGGRARLQCQDDANLVIVREQGGPIWASNTQNLPNRPQEVNQLGPFDTKYITFRDGIPVGGFAQVTMFKNGSYNFIGHFHDSGAPSYDISFVWGFKSASNVLFTFSQQGHLNGTFEPGSRDYDWSISGTNPALAAGWADLTRQYSWRWDASVNLDILPLVNRLKDAIGVVAAVVALV